MSAVTADQAVPLTSNGATVSPVDQKIDPSIGHAISHGEKSEASAAPAYAADAPAGTASSGLTRAAPEKGSSFDPTTTTTTTIITTTSGAPGANGSTVASPIADGSSLASPNPAQAATAPTSPVPGEAAAPSVLTAKDGNADTVASPTEASPAVSNGAAVPATAAAAAAGGAGAATLANKEGSKTEPAPAPMSQKEAKKYTKLLKKESKNEEKELASTLKAAHSDEKAMRKARKAEQQSTKRHQSAVEDEHKASKALNKAKLTHEKAAAALQKATEELDIKKRHTTATSGSYDKVKAKIDSLRDEKLANDKDRARRQASISHASGAA